MKTLDVRKKKADSGKIGLVKLKGWTQEVLQANQKLLIFARWCLCRLLHDYLANLQSAGATQKQD